MAHTPKSPPELMTCGVTKMVDGMVNLEIGDVLKFSMPPAQARKLGRMLVEAGDEPMTVKDIASAAVILILLSAVTAGAIVLAS